MATEGREQSAGRPSGNRSATAEGEHESSGAPATPEGADTPSSRLRLALPAIAATCFFAAVLVTLHLSGVLAQVYDRDALRAWVKGQGAWAPLVYVGFLMVRPFTLLPSTLFSPVAYALFGVVPGTLLKVCGESIGATLAMQASRHALRGPLVRALRAKAEGTRTEPSRFAHALTRLGGLAETQGMRTMLSLRLNLLLPFDAVNYGLGLTPMRTATFFFGTLVGILPGTLLYVSLAGSALEGEAWRVAFVLAAFALMIYLSVPLARELLASPRSQVAEEAIELGDDDTEGRERDRREHE